jgi:large subunit ribosomal protein L22
MYLQEGFDMEIKSHGRQIRISPKKVKPVLDLVRGKGVQEAEALLRYSGRKAGEIVLKLLNSAQANAENNFALDPHTLIISETYVSGGPAFKRGRMVSRGRWHPILKRTSHVTLILKEKEVKPLTPKTESVKKGDTSLEVQAALGGKKSKVRPNAEVKKSKKDKEIKRGKK